MAHIRLDSSEKKRFNKFIDKLNKGFDNEINKIYEFNYFFYKTRGSNFEKKLIKIKYLEIETQFFEVLKVMEEMGNGGMKIDIFIDLFPIIERTHLLERNFNMILKIIENINDEYTKRSAFEILVWTILKTPLLENNFPLIVKLLDTINDEKYNGFSSLIFSIELQQLIKNFPSILSSLNTIDDVDDKRTAFYELMGLIEESSIIEDHLIIILNVMDSFGATHRQQCFFDMISAIKINGLSKKKRKLILDRFPEYSERIEEILPKEG
ncbi:hypothetical protein LCGC14_2304720 [marine sediment metagenome]|uniref:Uncharacterized protein n=1 Tax=marine sediment metagenome TaxID=412755 RepID=A0A0F9D9V8_9ZZZZ